MNKNGLIVTGVLVAIIGAFVFGFTSNKSEPVTQAPAPTPGAFSGQPAARVATSSTIQVGPQQTKTLFALNTSCATRIVATVATPVQLSFDGVMIPSGTVGHPQGASSTVAYRTDEFGCAAVTAYAAASTTITISEANR